MASSSPSCSGQSGVKCSSCDVQVEEIHEFVWGISKSDIIYAEVPSDLETACLSFTIGQTTDAISRWKFFMLMNPETYANVDLFFRLEGYSSFDEGSIGVEVSIDRFSNSEKWEFKLAHHTFTSADVKDAAPTKCVFYQYRKSEYSTWVKKGTKSYTLDTIVEKSPEEHMKVRIQFKLFDTKGIANFRKQSDLLVMPERVAWGEIHKKGMFAMLQEGAASTITLRAKDGVEFVVNKAILAAHSPVFAAMFSTDMKEKNDGVVTIDDIGEGGLRIFLMYLFTGEVDKNWGNNYDEVINAADKYGVTFLKDTCDKLLPSLVTWENCVEFMRVARLFTLTTVIERIEKFMRSDPSKLIEIAMRSDAGKMSRNNF